MKRGLLHSLCAVALVALGSTAQAQNVGLSLNLRYTNPANPAQGGTWQLVADTTSANGIAAISAYISNISTSGVVYGNGGTITATTLGALTVGDDGVTPYVDTFGGVVNIQYGQNTANGPIVLNVGRGDGAGPNPAAPGEIADPLLNPTWQNASLIASGTFAGSPRPVFAPSGTNVTDSNTLASNSTTPPSNEALPATTSTVVRGDAERTTGAEVAGSGLFAGDANRSGVVNSADLALLLTSFNLSNRTWDQGNFNNTAGNPNTVVNSADLALLLTNFNQSDIPVSVSPVPEPGTLALAALGCLAAVAIRRKAA